MYRLYLNKHEKIDLICLMCKYILILNRIERYTFLKSTFGHHLFLFLHSEELLFEWKTQNRWTCQAMSLLAPH